MLEPLDPARMVGAYLMPGRLENHQRDSHGIYRLLCTRRFLSSVLNSHTTLGS